MICTTCGRPIIEREQRQILPFSGEREFVRTNECETPFCNPAQREQDAAMAHVRRVHPQFFAGNELRADLSVMQHNAMQGTAKAFLMFGG